MEIGLIKQIRKLDIKKKMNVDKLEHIYELQREFNQRVKVPQDFFDRVHDQQQWLHKMILATQQELAELVDSTQWAWWKPQNFDLQNAKVEVIDILHFVLSMAQILGMTPEDIYQAFLAKQEVNHKRQDSGYVTKDENDCRHILKKGKTND